MYKASNELPKTEAFASECIILFQGSIKLGSYKNVWDICVTGDRIVFDM